MVITIKKFSDPSPANNELLLEDGKKKHALFLILLDFQTRVKKNTRAAAA